MSIRGIFVPFLALGAITSVYAAENCQPDTASGAMSCVQTGQYLENLEKVAIPRPPQSRNWKLVQDFCKSRLEQLGYRVEVHHYGTGVNIIGTLDGYALPHEQVFLSAHYDSVRGCPAADDNASGVAGILEAARVLALRPHARTLKIACWDEEEDWMVGSTAYTGTAKQKNDKITASFVFDMIGYATDKPQSQSLSSELAKKFPKIASSLKQNQNRGNFIAMTYDAKAESFAESLFQFATEIGLPVMKFPVGDPANMSTDLADLTRSDHLSFWEMSYPGILLFDTFNHRNPHYHCYDDTTDAIDDLNHGFTTKVIQATLGAAYQALQE